MSSVEYDVRYLDRLFMRALMATRFGKDYRQKGVAFDNDCNRLNGAEFLYEHTGLHLTGYRSFAYIKLRHTIQYTAVSEILMRLPKPSTNVRQRLPEAMDEALVHAEVPTEINERLEFRDGVWQTYNAVRRLVPQVLMHQRDRKFIRRMYLKRIKKPLPVF